MGVADLNIAPEHVAGVISLVRSRRISRRAAGKVFARMVQTGLDPVILVAEMGLEQIRDSDELEGLVDGVIARCAGMAAEYRRGKHSVLDALIGRIMKQSGGRADPAAVRGLLVKRLRG